MDVAKKMADIALEEAASERETRELIELTEQLDNIDRQLKQVEDVRLRYTQQLTTLKKETAQLEVEIQVMKQREEMLDANIRSTMGELLVEQDKLEAVQTALSGRISEFLLLANTALDAPKKEEAAGDPALSEKQMKERQNHRCRYLQVRAELEAMRTYERFQQARIAQLKRAAEALLAEDP